MKIVVEPTGCLAAAGVVKLRARVAKKRIGVIVSGGNVDSDILADCFAHIPVLDFQDGI